MRGELITVCVTVKRFMNFGVPCDTKYRKTWNVNTFRNITKVKAVHKSA